MYVESVHESLSLAMLDLAKPAFTLQHKNILAKLAIEDKEEDWNEIIFKSIYWKYFA